MSDEIDVAQERDQCFRERAIASARAGVAGEGSEDCEDCGAPIDTARRRAMPSATRCVGCQESAERRRRRQRGV